MKSIHEPITVDLDAHGTPRAWRWRDRAWQVLRVLDRWVLQARWWTGCSERRDYLLLEAVPREAAHLAPAAASRHVDTDAASGDPDLDVQPPCADPAAPPDACAVEIYRRRLRETGEPHDAWILARILS